MLCLTRARVFSDARSQAAEICMCAHTQDSEGPLHRQWGLSVAVAVQGGLSAPVRCLPLVAGLVPRRLLALVLVPAPASRLEEEEGRGGHNDLQVVDGQSELSVGTLSVSITVH